MSDAVIVIKTGETLHLDEVSEIPDTEWRENFAIRTMVRELIDACGDDLSVIRETAVSASSVKGEESSCRSLLCPIGQSLFECPVVAEDGQTYENETIIEWISTCERSGGEATSPLTRVRISGLGLVRNLLMCALIEESIEEREEREMGASNRGLGARTASEIVHAFSERTKERWEQFSGLLGSSLAASTASTVQFAQCDIRGGTQSARMAALAAASAPLSGSMSTLKTTSDALSSSTKVAFSIFCDPSRERDDSSDHESAPANDF